MDRARYLRCHATDAERRLWSRLRGTQLGCKFRRQHRLLGYIVDFICLERRLVVELDSGQHAERNAYDARRAGALAALGLRVLRFWNHEALCETDAVVAAIVGALTEALPLTPTLSPDGVGGEGDQRPARNACRILTQRNRSDVRPDQAKRIA